VPLVTAAAVRTWGDKSNTSVSTQDAEIDRCVLVAQDWIGAQAARVLEEASFSEFLHGDEALGRYNEILYLPPGRNRMVKHTDPDLVVVKEDGTALTLATGYSTTADALLVGSGRDERAYLIRGNSEILQGWAKGRRNIELSWKCGWTSSNVPSRVAQLVMEVSWHFFNSGKTAGVSSVTRDNEVASIDKNLTLLSRQTLDELRVL
jgi:hypothetical protein